jgi:hypothetical protein
VTYIFTGSAHSFAASLAGWLDAAPAFKTFVETHRDKIRKKVRGIRDEESQRDLLAELATAYWLLQERRFTLEYEYYNAGGGRGPDFSVTFRTHIRFNVEVTRLRGSSPEAAAEGGGRQTKIVNTLCAKLGQMPPSVINVLLLVGSDTADDAADVAAAIHLLGDRATHKDDPFFTLRGFTGARDFQRQYSRLSAILFRPFSAGPPAPATLWANPQARHPLPADLVTLLQK